MISNISGVILAGGTNRRLNGITKANIIIDGKTIISRIIDTITDIFGEIIIVTNTPEEFKKYSGCKLVSDQFIKVGPLGGIHSALKASSNDVIFVFAGDMPLLNKDLIISQIDYYSNHKCDILIPRIDKYIEPLHSIYNKTITENLEEYLKGKNNFAVHEFFKRADVFYQQLEGTKETKDAFININTPADITEVKSILGVV